MQYHQWWAIMEHNEHGQQAGCSYCEWSRWELVDTSREEVKLDQIGQSCFQSQLNDCLGVLTVSSRNSRNTHETMEKDCTGGNMVIDVLKFPWSQATNQLQLTNLLLGQDKDTRVVCLPQHAEELSTRTLTFYNNNNNKYLGLQKLTLEWNYLRFCIFLARDI